MLKSPRTPTDLRFARLLTLERRPLAIVSFSEAVDLAERLDGVTRLPSLAFPWPLAWPVALPVAGPRRFLKLKVDVTLTVGENTMTSCARGLGGGAVCLGVAALKPGEKTITSEVCGALLTDTTGPCRTRAEGEVVASALALALALAFSSFSTWAGLGVAAIATAFIPVSMVRVEMVLQPLEAFDVGVGGSGGAVVGENMRTSPRRASCAAVGAAGLGGMREATDGGENIITPPCFGPAPAVAVASLVSSFSPSLSLRSRSTTSTPATAAVRKGVEGEVYLDSSFSTAAAGCAAAAGGTPSGARTSTAGENGVA